MPPLNTFTKTSIAIALSHAIAIPVNAATLTVNSLADDTTPNNSLCTLREAIVSVNSGVLNTDCGITAPGMNDAIVFDSVITASDTISLSNGPLSASNDMSITAPTKVQDGPFGFDRLTVRQTTLDSGVFYISNGFGNAGPVVTLTNLEITGGENDYIGGGISARGYSDVTIDDCVVQSNTASFGGGIFAGNGSTLTVSNSTIQGNSATADGGGLLAFYNSSTTFTDSFLGSNYSSTFGGALAARLDSTVTINASNIEFNSASTHGGCISGTQNSTITLNETFLDRCYASTFGGGVSLNDSNLSMNGSSISNSQARGTLFNEGGGGIAARAASNVTINDSYFSQNNSTNDGAALDVFAPAKATANRSSFSNNIATRFGGAVYATGTVTLNSSTVAFNSANDGGGLFANNGGSVNLNNSSVIANNAVDSGGGVQVNVGSSSNFTNSLISFNSSGASAREVYVNGSATTSTGGINLFGSSENSSAASFVNFTPTTPSIVATNDGNQPTLFSTIISGTVETAPNGTLFLPLASGSPAIGVASTADCPSRDQRDKDRENTLIVPIVAANNKIAVVDLGGECDVGAVEFD